MIARLRLARPHFLFGGALLFALGAFSSGSIDPTGYVIGQAMVTAIQLTAHLANEFADADTDRMVRNRTWFSGGSGAIPDGAVPRRHALVAAGITTAIAVAAIAAIFPRSVGAAVIGVTALTVAWLYSVEPVRLLATGYGEIAASLVVALAVPVVGVLSNGNSVSDGLWWAVAALVPIHIAMMLCFELPDLDTDREAGKRVLAVRFGRGATQRATIVLFGAGALVIVIGIVLGPLPDLAVVSLAAATPAAVAAWAMRRSRWGSLTLGAVATLVVSATGLLLGLG